MHRGGLGLIKRKGSDWSDTRTFRATFSSSRRRISNVLSINLCSVFLFVSPPLPWRLDHYRSRCASIRGRPALCLLPAQMALGVGPSVVITRTDVQEVAEAGPRDSARLEDPWMQRQRNVYSEILQLRQRVKHSMLMPSMLAVVGRLAGFLADG